MRRSVSPSEAFIRHETQQRLAIDAPQRLCFTPAHFCKNTQPFARQNGEFSPPPSFLRRFSRFRH
jgi:hypothetical protein